MLNSQFSSPLFKYCSEQDVHRFDVRMLCIHNRVHTFFIKVYGNPKILKDLITQILRIPSFLKLKIVLTDFGALKVSKNHINYTGVH